MIGRRMAEIVRNQKPLTLTTGATIKQACERMRDRNVGAVLVTDEDTHLLGVFTGRDAVCRVLAEGMDSTRVHSWRCDDPKSHHHVAWQKRD